VIQQGAIDPLESGGASAKRCLVSATSTWSATPTRCRKGASERLADERFHDLEL
jgi:hypothetical protein